MINPDLVPCPVETPPNRHVIHTLTPQSPTWITRVSEKPPADDCLAWLLLAPKKNARMMRAFFHVEAAHTTSASITCSNSILPSTA
ncbi:MAG TPA: hypothetical protein PKI69_12550, partial [Rhodocyclaceae bacterium]|nr:hypothetical protein [Rhodocyclaceae bacterium]